MRATSNEFRSTLLVLVLSCAPVAPLLAQSAAGAQTGAGSLTLDEVYRLARERSPVLRAAASVARARAALEPSAGLPPDPTLQLGAMNVSVPGLDANMPASMAPSIQLMQMLPVPGKLGLSGRVAELGTAMAVASAEEAWWEVRGRAAMAFYMIYEADRQLEVMRETLRLLQDFERVARAMYGAGMGRQSDVLRAGVEVARMDAEIARMIAMRLAGAARLNAVLDRPADTAVPAVTFAPLPLELPHADTLRQWAAERRPMLERGRLDVERARTRTALVRKEIWPDPVVGVQYGQRAGEMGTERMASFMVGVSVPVFAKQRQMRMRDEAAAMEETARAELAQMRADVDARIGELLADLERTRTLVTLYRTEVLPQAKANVESSFASYRVGQVDFMTLVDAQMTVNEYEQELFGLLSEFGRAVAELEMAVGRALPRTRALLTEVP